MPWQDANGARAPAVGPSPPVLQDTQHVVSSQRTHTSHLRRHHGASVDEVRLHLGGNVPLQLCYTSRVRPGGLEACTGEQSVGSGVSTRGCRIGTNCTPTLPPSIQHKSTCQGLDQRAIGMQQALQIGCWLQSGCGLRRSLRRRNHHRPTGRIAVRNAGLSGPDYCAGTKCAAQAQARRVAVRSVCFAAG